MTTMLEKAARAICESGMRSAGVEPGPDFWAEFCGPDERAHFETQARAALLAIREPSLDLGVIGAGPVNEHMRGKCKADVFAAQDAFTAMIDAILEEPSNG
jgi:hypothetical protein